MKIFIVVVIVSAIIGGFVGGELTDRTFLLTGAVIGGIGVGAIIFGLGGFFAAQEKRKRNATSSPELTPEIREVFGRMAGGAAKRFAEAKSEDKKSPRALFKLTVAFLISNQLLPQFTKPGDAFGMIITDKRAMGYIYGMHDAMLQAYDLHRVLEIAEQLIEESYSDIFGKQSGNAMLHMSVAFLNEAQFQAGRNEGGDDVVDFVKNKVPPLGLNRIAGSNLKCNA